MGAVILHFLITDKWFALICKLGFLSVHERGRPTAPRPTFCPVDFCRSSGEQSSISIRHYGFAQVLEGSEEPIKASRGKEGARVDHGSMGASSKGMLLVKGVT